MDNSFSPKGMGIGYWTSPQVQWEGLTLFDGGTKNSVSEEMVNKLSELMEFDTYAAGWCNIPSMPDHSLGNGLSSFASVPCPSPDGFNLLEPGNGPIFMTEDSSNYKAMESSSGYGEKVVLQQMDTQLGMSDDANDANNLDSKPKFNGSFQQFNTFDVGNHMIPGPYEWSLDERMLRALSFFKESVGGGILAQLWVPMKHGDEFILTTSEQPYLLDHTLSGYREVSRTFTFSVDGKSGSSPGLPGRVFKSHVPEWTSHVGYYSKNEYLRMDHAINHKVRGSIAIPITDLHSELPCCAVLELVTTKEKPDFDRELEVVSNALQLVDLQTTMPPRLLSQCLSDNKKAALTEINDVLRAVCHAHRLPLALTWIPCSYSEGIGDEAARIQIKEGHTGFNEKSVLCTEESACYINDRAVGGFVHACVEHPLEEGQGIAGKARQSNHPFFYPDVKEYDVTEYPLVQHARKYNLNAAVAVRLRSTYTNDDDYILEFFLPVNMRGSQEQQLLLDNLSGIMQRISTSLRTVSEAELSGIEGSQVGFQKENVSSFSPMSRINCDIALSGNRDSVQMMSLKPSNLRNNGIETAHNKAMNGSRRQVEKKRSTVEKNVSLSVLQKYFSGSLKDAAKSIGVCPTTLKRICRQHGILRWPSRKINKVNRSLKKIQTVLDSVQGVEGGLKFDPYTGGFVTGGSINQEIDAHKSFLFPEKHSAKDTVAVPPAPGSKGDNLAVKFEDDDICMDGNQLLHSSVLISDSKGELKKDQASSVDFSEDSKSVAIWGMSKSSLGAENSSHDIACHSPSSLIADEIEIHADGTDGADNHLSSSSMTNSYNSSGSIIHRSSSCSSSENDKRSKVKSTCVVDSGSKMIVKATYREDTIRFKFNPSAGCLQLYEEVATRFKLHNGSFQLKYLDDEDEWVMMVNDSDLQECVEILDDLGTRNVKFLVRSMPSSLSSRQSNSCFLADSS